MTPSPLFDALFVKVRAWLLTLVPVGTEIVRGYVNRVPQPTADHIVITALFERRLRTNLNRYEDDGYGSTPGTREIEQGTEIHFQFDYYGASAANLAAVVSTLWRDEAAVAALAPDMAPLYIDDARNMTHVFGEEQYVPRFTSTAVAQYNPTVTVPQQFADAAEVGLVEADTLL